MFSSDLLLSEKQVASLTASDGCRLIGEEADKNHGEHQQQEAHQAEERHAP